MFRMHELTAAVSLFPNKLFHMVNDQQCTSLIWGGDGDHLVINTRRFEDEMLQETASRWKYQLKTTSTTSFIRQLHAYGFRKVIESFDLISIREPNHIRHYYHPYFHRDRPDLLIFMKRSIRSGLSRRQSTEESLPTLAPQTSMDPLQTPIGEPLLRNLVPQNTLNQTSLAFQQPDQITQSPLPTLSVPFISQFSSKRKRKTQPRRHPSFEDGRKIVAVEKQENIAAICNQLHKEIKTEKFEENEESAFLVAQKEPRKEMDEVSDVVVPKNEISDQISNSDNEEQSMTPSDSDNEQGTEGSDDPDWGDESSLPTMIVLPQRVAKENTKGSCDENSSPNKAKEIETKQEPPQKINPTRTDDKLQDVVPKVKEVAKQEQKSICERHMVTRSSQRKASPAKQDKPDSPIKVVIKESKPVKESVKKPTQPLAPTVCSDIVSTQKIGQHAQSSNMGMRQPNFIPRLQMPVTQAQKIKVPQPMQPASLVQAEKVSGPQSQILNQNQGSFTRFPQPLNARIQIPPFSILQPAYIAWPTRNMYCTKTEQLLQPPPTIIPLPFKPFQVQQAVLGGHVNMPGSAFPVVQPQLLGVKQETMVGNINEQIKSMGQPRFVFTTTT